MSDEAMGVSVRADFAQFEKALKQLQNQTDAGLARVEKRFSKSNATMKTEARGMSGAFDELKKGASGALAGLPGLGGGINAVGLAGAGAALGVGALVAALRGVQSAAKFAADLTDAADRIGVGVEALQELRYAADETGVDIAKLDGSLEALNGTLGAFKTGIGAGKITPIFKALGLTQADLASVNNANDLLPLLADRLGQIESRAEQVQLARKLGIEPLLPMLRLGSQALGQMAQEGRDLGLVLSKDVVAGLDETDRALEKQQQQIDANVRSMQANLAPFFLWVSDGFAKLTRGVGDFINSLDRAENRNARVLASQSDSLRAKVTSAYQRPGGVNGELSAVQKKWVRELEAVNAQIAARARSSIADAGPSAADRAAEAFTPDYSTNPKGGGRGRADREAQRATQRQRRLDDEVFRANTEVLQAQSQLATTAEQRASLAILLLDQEREGRKIELERQVTDGEITTADRARLIAAEERVRIAREQNIAANLASDQAEEQSRIERQMTDFTAQLLQTRSGMALTATDRMKIERELLALAQQERRRALERAAADQSLSPAARQGAKSMLGGLGALEASENEALRQSSGPVRDAQGIASGIIQQDNLGADTAAMYAEIESLRRQDLLSEEQAAQARQEINARYWDQRLSGEQEMLGQLAGLASSSNKTLARIGKAAAIAQATIDGVLAVQKALASAPPPMNFVAAAVSGAVAAANVAKIAGMKDGGVVRGPGGPRDDRVPAMLSAGEFVVNAKATAQNRQALEAMNRGGVPKFADGGMVGRAVRVPNIQGIASNRTPPQQPIVFDMRGAVVTEQLLAQVNAISAQNTVTGVALVQHQASEQQRRARQRFTR